MVTSYSRLSALDSSFLYMEAGGAHMHVGALAVYDDPGFDEGGLRRHVEGRLHRVPRFRQKLAWVPGHQGRPCWVDDPSFHLASHVHLTDLPAPGDEAALLAWASQLLGAPLDRSRPLWELWAARTGDGHFALLTKLHHCLVDGVSAVGMGAAIMDLEPDATPDAPTSWSPDPEPGRLQLLADALAERADQPRRLWSSARAMARSPRTLAARGREALEGMVAYGRAGLELAPRTSFNRPIGPRRRFAVVRSDLQEIKRIKARFGCKVNDVVLALVTGGVRHLMLARGEAVEGRTLRSMVPVNRRAADEDGAYGNRVSWVVADLPVGLASPEERLAFVHRTMTELKQSKQSLGAELYFKASEYAPPTALALGVRAVSRYQRTFNLIVTNVPGPQVPLFLAGGEMREAFPVVPIAGTTSLGVAVLSYNGKVCFGLQGDADLLGDDLPHLARGIEQSLQELSRV
jgi:diacylglycerol O-acyltransferase / wax synthase